MTKSFVMGFLTKAQIIVLRDKIDIVNEAKAELRRLCKQFSAGHLHSQACEVGGINAGACNNTSGESPCPCGAEDQGMTVEQAYERVGERRTRIALVDSWAKIDTSKLEVLQKASFPPACQSCPYRFGVRPCPHLATCVKDGRTPNL